MKTPVCLIVCLLLLLLSSSCKEQDDDLSVPSQNAYAASDSVSTTNVSYLPINIQRKRIAIDTMAAPQITMAGPPKKVPAYNNAKKIVLSPPEIIQPNTNLPFQIKQLDIRYEKTAVTYPTPSKAKEADFKDNAIYDIRFWDVKHGLNSSYIHAIFQDSKGYLWFGGWEDGICRFDGDSFLTFNADQGLKKEAINTIWEDKNGDLWLGTKEGLVKYDGYYFTDYPEITAYVSDIFKDSQGRIFIATYEGLIWEEEGSFYTLTSENFPPWITTSVVEDNKGNIWFGTKSGLYRWNKEELSHWAIDKANNGELVLDLFIADDGILWIATIKGAWMYDGTSFRYISNLEGKEVRKVIQANNGDIWLGVFQDGVYRYDGEYLHQYTEKEGLNNNEVFPLLEDDKGQIWVGMHSGGVDRINPNSFINLTKEEGLSSNKFNHFITDSEGHTWMATEYEGVMKYDGTHYYYYSEEHGGLPVDRIQYLLEDKAKNLWFGSYAQGLIKFDGKKFTYYTTENGLCGNEVWYIVEDKQGLLWISTLKGGLCSFDGKEFIHYQMEDGTPISRNLLIAQGENLWLSNYDDFFKYDGQTFYRVQTAAGHSVRTISVLEDTKHRLWLASPDGVYLFDEETFTHYTTKNGLSNNEVWSINQDIKNNIWIGTEKGLNFAELNENAPIKFKTFKEVDGLKTQDNIHNSSYRRGNELWWGMGKNLLQLDLNKFYTNIDSTPPTVHLNNIRLNDLFFDFSQSKKVQLSNGKIEYSSRPRFQNYPNDLVISHKINHLSFDFSGLEWSAPHDIVYRYLLEGLEEDWSPPTKESRIDYRSLPYGAYTFKVQAKGRWSDWSEVLPYSFTIRPPWWHTWWAYLLYGGLFCTLIYGISNVLQRRLVLRNQLKQEQDEAQRLKELDSFKSRLYTNLTHEFRTPLTVILGMTQHIKSNPKQFLDTGTKLIERNGKSLLRLINQLLDLSKLENNAFQLQLQQADIVAYLRYLTESFQTYTNSHNLSLQFYCPLEELQMDYDPEQVQQIMTNLLSNAVKYTRSGGAIKVNVAQNGQQLYLKIEDTGIGIAAADLPYVFDRFYQVDNSATRKEEGTGIGLAHTRELVRLMGGKIKVESEIEKGTVFSILLPVTTKAVVKTPELLATDLADVFPKPEGNNTTNTAQLPQLLIIEDNPDVVTYLEACLVAQYHIDIAFNGKIGIEKALENSPDLIISDVMMPEKDGYEVCNTLKQDERTSHIPIILLTAKADTASKIIGLKRGADAYLAKPFDKEELLTRLEQLLERQQRITNYLSRKMNEESLPHSLESAVQEAIAVEDEFIKKVRKIVAENYTNEDFALPQLCQKIGMSRSQIFRKMKVLINQSPSDFIRTYRLKEAKKLLETGDFTVSEVAWKVGYKYLPHFSNSYQELFGESPSTTNN